MKKSIILAAAFLSLVACQKTQQTEATDEEAVIETPADTVMAGSDTIAVAETEQKADAVANEDKDIKVVAAKEVKVDYPSPMSFMISCSRLLNGISLSLFL